MKNLNDIARRLNALEEDKQAQFRRALAEKGIDSWTLPIVPYEKADHTRLPLSAGQQRLWFIDRYEQGSSLYNLSATLRLTGRLDVGKLQRAFAIILQRHEILRSVYIECDGRGYQQIRDKVDLPLVVETLGDRDGFEQDFDRWLAALYRREQENPFDLARDLPVRVRLIRVAEDQHILVLTVHHIAFDAWSQEAIVRELSLLYSCPDEVMDNALPPLSIQYKDYALWQQQWLAGEAYQRQLEYWQRQLADSPACLPLPLDMPRGKLSEQRHRGREVRLALGPEVSEQLRAQAKAHNVSVYAYLLTVFKLILRHYGGGDDIVVGTSVANRQRPELESLAGLFVNTLVLRSKIGADMRFADLLHTVAETSQQAVGHQDLPFDHLLDALRVERSDSHTPLFQVLFVYLNLPDQQALTLGDVSVEILPHSLQHARFDLTLRVEEQDSDGLCLCMEYDTDLFYSGTIEQMLDDYRALCARLCGTAPGESGPALNRISLAAAEENAVQTTRRLAAPASALEMFEASVRTRPSATALCVEEAGRAPLTRSYGELALASRKAAQCLAANGVKAGDRVGLCLERGVALVTAILACWRVGAAYVAFDPQWPDARRQQLAARSDLALLIAEDDLTDGMASTGLSVFSLSQWQATQEATGEKAALPAIALSPELPAYLIFTSGSTGNPKAVSVTHANLADYVTGIMPQLQLPENAHIASLGTLAADLGHTAVFGALLSGRCLRLLGKNIAEDPACLAQAFRRQPVHCLKITPSHLKGFSDVLADILPVELLILGGELFDGALYNQLRETLAATGSRCRLLNHYGPTETCVGVLSHAANPADSVKTLNQSVPLGRALPNVRAHVLDKHLNPVPPGAVGELYIGGPAVAQGYYGQGGLSAERFLPDPFDPAGQGGRMYRTGDRVRLTRERQLEYIGRDDNQVKIRGYRVEIGEIEQRLRQALGDLPHGACFDDAVLAVQTRTEQPRLQAFLSGSIDPQEADAAITSIQTALGKVLPEYMLPSEYTVLAEFPRLANGKVDRRALTEWDPQIEQETDFGRDEPTTDSEKTLAGIWCEVLGRERVGVNDNFFSIGGDSILSLQVLARAKKQGIALKPKQFFDGKTIVGMLALIEARPAATTTDSQPGIPVQLRQHPDQTWPLSYAQERLWWLYQYDPSSTRYNLPVALEAEGEIDPGAVQTAINDLLARYEALRTGFVDDGGRGVQIIHRNVHLSVPLLDLSGASPDEQQQHLQQIIAEDQAKPFNLQQPPLLRLSLVRLNAQHHVLIFNMHHICTDGWSMKLLLQAFADAYAARRHGKVPRFVPLAVQYVDFACWQRRQLEAGDSMARLKRFWQAHLAGTEPVLDLPADKVRPARQSFSGARLTVDWPQSLNELVQSVARQTAKTPFMLIMAAFQLCLRHYSGQREFRVGYPVNGRNHPDTQGLIGFFVNTLVLPARVRDHLPVNEFLNRVEATLLATQAQQDMPFEQLVQLLERNRDLSRSPLFQVMLNFQHASLDDDLIELDGLRMRPLVQSGTSAKFDLTLDITEHRLPQGVRYSAEFEYCTAIFVEQSVRRLARHFTDLLQGMLENPDCLLRELPVRPNTGARALQRQSVPVGEGLLQRLSRLAKDGAHAPALIDAEGTLTYAELDAEANRLAQWLVSRQIGAEDIVGVNLPRARRMLIAMLAIQKAGAAYLPLDPQHPAERRLYMLEQSRAGLMLSDASLEAFAPFETRCPVYDIHIAAAEARAFDPVCPPVTLQAQQLAYTIYTSGSTGKPKGVQVTREALDNLLLGFQHDLQLKPGDKCLALTTVSFDISALELFLPLLTGACVVLADEAQRVDPDALMALIHQHDIAMVQATPATWRMLLSGAASPWPQREHPIKALCGGEALPTALARALADKPLALVNVYGPTETTIWSSSLALDADALAWQAANVSIGTPIANTQLYILDEYLRPVPEGAQGMLFIGGVGLARGYAGRPGLTADAFVPNPFADDGSRLYHTGDCVRIDARGYIEYLGRRDGQIKLHGYRIELPEIEACLNTVPALQGAAAVVHGDQLAAYWVRNENTADNALVARADEVEQRMREALKANLPDYMHPYHLIELETLPLTASGKVDRKTLAAKALPKTGPKQHTAPRNAVEKALAELWREVLSLENLGIDENFFGLGGHSLLATQLVARSKGHPLLVKEGVATFISLRLLFSHPTVANLAEQLQNMATGEPASDQVLPDLRAYGTELSAPLSFQQQRLWIIDQMEGGSAAYNMSLTARLQGDFNLEAAQRSIDTILARHAVLQTRFATEDDAGDVRSVQVAAPETSVTIECLPFDGNEQTIKTVLAEASDRAFDLGREAPLRVCLLRLCEREHILQLTIHHIATDAWSMHVALQEFMVCYRAFLMRREPSLPELPIQYRDFARWQQETLQGQTLQRYRDFWLEQLNGYSGLLPLALDKVRPDKPSYKGRIHRFQLSVAQIRPLKALAQAQGTSLFMVLMAVYQLLLHKETGSDDIVVGTDVANRPHPALENLIGFFVNVLPIRSRLQAPSRFIDYLAACKERLLSAFEHQQFPFEHMVETLQLPRVKGANPLVQTLFVMQNTPDGRFELPGLSVETLSSEDPSSRFDMALFVEESAGEESADALRCQWIYATDLFTPNTIARLADGWVRLLTQIGADAERSLSDYQHRDSVEESNMQNQRTRRKLGKLKSIKAKPVVPLSATGTGEWVRQEHLASEATMPLVFHPTLNQLDPYHWAEQNRNMIDDQLLRFGAVLFRGFNLRTAVDFENFARALYPSLYGNYGDLPKEQSGKRIYKSTPYPENQMILYHNESSHMHQWPRRQWFFSQVVAQDGGCTPIVDCRRVYRELPQHIVQAFETKGLLYVRNFTHRLDVSWQDYFKTDSRDAVEQRCRETGTDFEWFGENRLQIRERAPGVIRHPLTGEASFFNQVQLHHAACLEDEVRRDLEAMVGLEGLPRHVYYGDGTPIDDAVIRQIIDVYQQLAVRFPWQVGDVLMVDNMLIAHARDPFTGPRKIAVAMADLQRREDFYSSTQSVEANGPVETA